MRKIVMALLIAAVTACGGDSTAPNGDVTGAWHLRTVNGMSLPHTFPHYAGDLGVTTTLLDVVETVSPNGSFSHVETHRVVAADGTTHTDMLGSLGTWLAAGGSITFHVQTPGEGIYNGSINGNTLTEVFDGLTLVYGR